MKTSRILPRAAASIAALGLVLSAFPPAAQAQSNANVQAQIQALLAQVAALKAQMDSGASVNASFNRDLTIGSSGADVTALQQWLISKGFTITAGATGYFGGQTQAALARYQASVGISPAAGYLGAITRARVSAAAAPGPMPAPNPSPLPSPDEDDSEDDDDDSEEDEQDDSDEAEEAVEDAREALDDARDELEEANDDGENTDDAEDLLDEAEELLDEAEEALDDEEYEDARDLADDAEELIDEALEDIGANDEDDEDDEDEDDNDDVSTSAKAIRVSGADNDYAQFRIEFDLKAFGDDAFIDDDASVAFDYDIQDSSGNAVTSQTQVSAYIRSSDNDTEDGYFVIEEGDEERLTLTVIFDPLPGDAPGVFRLQLNAVNYADSASAPDEEFKTRPSDNFRTNSVAIAD